ncbi:MAG: GreA/GreB family elongation factor [Pseudomonadota bacterium]|uniref:GreA/GreB family elongation factor n=1 Tax=Halomonas sp. IOP_31 TaxID=2876584 RepID=UPI001E4FCDA7|nr:GreA/GreB family elongation factor [Halomonas sp. IOP_31]MCD6009062.1 GreA/GreB family elongation factor [Halomonas sp. IOP_31]MEA3251747.1 GreA/GreB family elongation factor [Pseudomonadota bacterium]
MLRRAMTLNRLDAERLQRLIDEMDDIDEQRLTGTLQVKLDLGIVFDPQELPASVVSMNTQIRLTDPGDARSVTCTLVFPHSLDSVQDGLSVFTDLGADLLGRCLGDCVSWPRVDGSRQTLRIDAILWQPEASGQFHR